MNQYNDKHTISAHLSTGIALFMLLLLSCPYAANSSDWQKEAHNDCIAIVTAEHNESNLRDYENELSTGEHDREIDEISKRDYAHSVGDLVAEVNHTHKATEHARESIKHRVDANDHHDKVIQISTGIIPEGATACITSRGTSGFIFSNTSKAPSSPARKSLREVFGG